MTKYLNFINPIRIPIYFLILVESIALILVNSSQANAFTLVSASEDYSTLRASYSWNGTTSDLAYESSFNWWGFRGTPNSSGNVWLELYHLPKLKYGEFVGAQIFALETPENLSKSFQILVSPVIRACDSTSTDTDVCSDTYRLDYQPNVEDIGGIFNISGDRVSYLPTSVSEPDADQITGFVAGLVIIFSIVLRSRSKSIVS